jgi:hypothetical protein
MGSSRATNSLAKAEDLLLKALRTIERAVPRVMAARRLDMMHTSVGDEPFVVNGEKAVR